MKVLSSINQWLDDRVNPIVIKELRQAVQGRFLVWVLFGFLLLQMVFLGGNLLSADVSSSSWVSSRAGQQYFVLLLGILSGTCLLFVPVLTGLRMASERSEQNADLLYITTLSPRAIITGKFLASMLLTILIFSACAPFMTISFLMRGIDVYTIGFCLLIALTAVASAIQLSIFAACIPVGRFFRSVIGLAVLGALFFLFIMVMASSSDILRHGATYAFGRSNFYWVLGSFALGVVAVVGLMFVLSIALITAPSANRAVPVRLFLTILFLICHIYALTSAFVIKSYRPLFVWSVLGALGLSGILVFSMNEREELGYRVTRTIPQNFAARVLYYPFYSGVGSGFIWVLTTGVVMAVSALILANVHSGWKHWYEMKREIYVGAGIFCFALSYSVTGYFVRRTFLKRLPSGYTWAIALIVFAASGVLPMLVAFLTGSFASLQDGTLVFTPFVLSSYKHKDTCFAISAVWATISLFYMLPIVVRKFRVFTKPAMETEDEAGVS